MRSSTERPTAAVLALVAAMGCGTTQSSVQRQGALDDGGMPDGAPNTPDDGAQTDGGAPTDGEATATPARIPGKVVTHDVQLGSGHPGAAGEVSGAEEIQGKLVIDGDDRDNLLILSCLTRVTGNVEIGSPLVCSPSFGCIPGTRSRLKNLAGLERLTSIGGSLQLDENGDLISLEALSGLTGSVENLYLGNNPLLTRIPALRGVTHVRGSLSLSRAAVTSLDGLESITAIDGDINVNASPGLVNLTGLEGVVSIGGSVVVSGNKGLVSFAGLDNVKTIIGTLDVRNNSGLKNFAGLGALGEIRGDLLLGSNQGIESFAGLESLRAIRGSLTVTGEKSLATLAPLSAVTFVGFGVSLANTHLTNLDEFPRVSKLPGGLAIMDAPYLTNLRGLATVTETATLNLSQLPALTSLAGLEGLTRATEIWLDQAPGVPSLAPLSGVRGDTEVRAYNTGLKSFTGLEGLTTLRWLVVNNNAELTTLTGLEGIATATYVDVRFNPKLASMAGLSSLTTVDGDVVIMHNDALTSITGLEKLTTVTGNLEVGRNPLVTTLAPLSGVRGVVTGLWVSGGSVADLHGLEGITGTHNVLGIGTSNYDIGTSGSTKLTSLRGLEGITSAGSLQLWDNTALVDLGGLANLDIVTETVSIQGNTALKTLGALSSLKTVNGQLAIFDNTSLPNCEAVALATRLSKTCGPNEVFCQNVCDCPGNNGTGTCP